MKTMISCSIVMGNLLLLATMIFQMKMIFQSGSNGVNWEHNKEMCHLQG